MREEEGGGWREEEGGREGGKERERVIYVQPTKEDRQTDRQTDILIDRDILGLSGCSSHP